MIGHFCSDDRTPIDLSESWYDNYRYYDLMPSIIIIGTNVMSV